MQLKQLVHVGSSKAAARQLYAQQTGSLVRFRQLSLEWNCSRLGLIKAIQSTYPFDGSLMISYFEMTALSIAERG